MCAFPMSSHRRMSPPSSPSSERAGSERASDQRQNQDQKAKKPKAKVAVVVVVVAVAVVVVVSLAQGPATHEGQHWR